MQKRREILLLLGFLGLGQPATGQATPSHTIRGALSTIGGAPVAGASIFLLESLDVAVSDSAGRFTIRTTAQGEVTVVARRIGFAPATVVVSVDSSRALAISMIPQAAVLTPITVQAGAYKAGNERGSTLTALEVVSTPGATADVARAMQTLPGVQNVDEGTGLFVRGGDVSETKVILNNVVMLSPYMNDFEARLSPEQFLRVHRSHIVNLNYVSAIEPFDGTRLQILMKDGAKITASRTRSRQLRGLAI